VCIVNLLRCILLLALLAVISLPAAAQGMESGVALDGLTGVEIRVHEMSSLDPADGLSKELIRGDVEKLLKKAGLKVLSEEEWLSAPGNPTLSVKINIRKETKRSHIAILETRLEQNVSLERDPSKRLSTITWTAGETLTDSSTKELATEARRYVEIFVEQFISDWEDANRAQ
jgi:hypothetical protein